jgi:photosystem II stability/assembly factor-like uncharacterized protein
VHPDDPDIACICALGREWGPNEERGVFKTTDGGITWKKVLYLDEDTGCSDLAIDFSNPRIMYAGMWTFRRKPWRFDEGGKNTAVYRSKNGGETWEKIMKGLPDKPMARIGLAVAQSQPETVYMITEFKEEGSLFRSDNRGSSWKMVNDDPNINFRPFYYSDIRVDPNNPNVVYSLSGRLNKSTDGGKTFEVIARDVHGDHQSFWIDPHNSNRLLSGSDGGYQVSFDAGKTWDIINNVELSQFYQLQVDNQDPYYVYGGLQDNGCWTGPSNSLYSAGILKRHWKRLSYGDGYYAEPIPGSEHEVYTNLQGGVPFHVNSNTGVVRSIHPYHKIIGSAGDAIENHKYRFNWDSPISISPHDPNTVYFGGNVVFISNDRGYNWDIISPDLTTNDKSKQLTSGGDIYQDNTAAEFHCSILSIAESPVTPGVIWVGTDDGNLQLTKDAGATWKNLKDRLHGLPDFSWMAKIHASEHDAGTAFVAIDNHRNDDFSPYAYVTTNYGKSWEKITNGLPADDYVKVIRQDPHYPNILYIGMEHGVYASWDFGKNWSRINNNLPPVSVRDLRVQARERDLVVGTHGRGVWILDDIRPLQELKTVGKTNVLLFPPRTATRWHYYSQVENLGQRTYRAKNPEYGAYINFFLKEDATEEVKVLIVNKEGNMIRELKDTTCVAGINRIVWDLRSEGATQLNRPPNPNSWRSGPFRPLVVPGEYSITLIANGEEHQSTVTIRADPRLDLSQKDYQAQNEEMKKLISNLSEVHSLINKADDLSHQLKDLMKRIGSGEDNPELLQAIKDGKKNIESLRDDHLLRPAPSMGYRQRPRLREETRSIMYAIDGATARPTTAQLNRVVQLNEETIEVKKQFDEIIAREISTVNKLAGNMPIIQYRLIKP